MLHIGHLSKQFDEFHLRDINLDIGRGDYFVLLGPSGAGKTVLFETIAGINTPDKGIIELNNKEITRAKIRDRRIGLVFQEGAVFPHLTVAQNIGYPLKMKKIGKANIHRRTTQLAEQVGIGPLLHRKPETLSGGELKRVAIARALALEPECLLLDEPLSSIDTRVRDEILFLLKKLNRDGLTILHITHDYREAFSQARKIAVMDKGRIIQQGTPEEIVARPASKFIARFIGIRNFFDFEKTDDNHILIEKALKLELTGNMPEKGQVIIPPESIEIATEDQNHQKGLMVKGIIDDLIKIPGQPEMIVHVGIRLHTGLSAEKAKQLSPGNFVNLILDPAKFKFF